MEPATPPVKVPVADVVIAAYRQVFGRLGLVLDLGWLPLLVVLAALLVPELVLRNLAPVAAAAAAAPLVDIGDLAQQGTVALCLGVFALSWYRRVLFADAGLRPRRLTAATSIRFIAYTLTVWVLFAGLGAAVVVTAPAAGDDVMAAAAPAPIAVLATALSLAVTRLSLLFPAAAAGAPLAPGAAWRAMRGNSWRLVGASLLVVAPIMLFLVVLNLTLIAAELVSPSPPAAPSPLGLVLLAGVIDAVLGLVLAALGASILADFYRRILGAAASSAGP